MVISITFDTNCILRDGIDSNVPYYNQIKIVEKLEHKGLVKIYKTDVQDTEIAKCNDPKNPPISMGERLAKSSQFEEQLGVGVYGYSRYSHTGYGSRDNVELESLKTKQTRSSKSENIADIMVLHTHKKHGNDYLLTNTQRIFY